ncbi:hypothetical protein AN480_29875 (plasmid) [Mycobacterium intracellulare subsp. chimaera]|uniref:Uncharacterized protein n=1 Tax=Mycobacterium intracellulare subsp. chimaera TaxID=222805 RepID=A0ABT7P9T9_MYCIT|nr:hypothetical protein [Mycobacterium intracellulare]APD84584.1 hypothetical protein AN480_29875 [Mycobacterium intracellulare subsp. chimaera]MDM3929831.1 hypothetical protein [Mycobacterium intracellulare subsp. chimaera]
MLNDDAATAEMTAGNRGSNLFHTQQRSPPRLSITPAATDAQAAALLQNWHTAPTIYWRDPPKGSLSVLSVSESLDWLTPRLAMVGA